ncbi:MAG: class I SAM-dependent methyltransferase [Lachnospiraceae bacterium]|nr:class I SAM-dependent methyltransferase [Lachnospiraceae bacterium]
MISTRIKDVDMVFETAPSIFSPNSIDEGTLAMLSVIDFLPSDKVLDLGCGYGVVGILAAKLIGEENVIMCDISEQAIEYATMNLRINNVPDIRIRLSDGYKNVGERDFTLILSNPPYHADFSVPKHFIEVGLKKLVIGGKLIMVTKRLDWYKNKLTSVFGGVKVHEINGYYVFVAEKRILTQKDKNKSTNSLSKKLQRKQQRKKMNRKK